MYSSLCVGIKKNEMGAEYNTQGQRKGAWRVMVRKPEGKRPSGRLRLSWLYGMQVNVQK